MVVSGRVRKEKERLRGHTEDRAGAEGEANRGSGAVEEEPAGLHGRLDDQFLVRFHEAGCQSRAATPGAVDLASAELEPASDERHRLAAGRVDPGGRARRRRDPQTGAAVLLRPATQAQPIPAGRRRMLVREEDVVERGGQPPSFEEQDGAFEPPAGAPACGTAGGSGL
jgi:hypothetical protein